MANKIRFLHISKTGGSTLKVYIKAFSAAHPDVKIKKFNHGTTLKEACTNEPDAVIAFFVREPISRFTSGFYSRMREGLPSHHRAWTPAEKRTFAQFKTPNELAEALSSWNPLRRIAAHRGMKAIAHIRRTYKSVLGSVEFLEKNRDRIGFILRQDYYDADFAKMIQVLGLDPDIPMPTDESLTHKAPSGEDRRISDKARANLTKWLRDDYPVYEWCLRRREEILKAHGLD